MRRMGSREDTIESLLRSHMEPGTLPASTPCPAPDVLAARFERRLTADETAEVDRHVATCDRCRETMVLLVRSEPPAVATPRPGRASPWRWLVPSAATLAVGAILWTVIDPMRQIEQPESRVDVSRSAGDERAVAVAQPEELEASREQAAPLGQPAPPPAEPLAARAPAAVAPVQSEVGRIEVASLTDASVRWRLGAAGSVEQSRDGGATWRPQQTGVDVELRAASAPSSTVCWAVGRNGIIIRTQDGSTWNRVASPTQADLVSVAATSRRAAVVVTQDGDRFRTEDGGARWAPLP